jgi:hypothetical protein
VLEQLLREQLGMTAHLRTLERLGFRWRVIA